MRFTVTVELGDEDMRSRHDLWVFLNDLLSEMNFYDNEPIDECQIGCGGNFTSSKDGRRIGQWRFER